MAITLSVTMAKTAVDSCSSRYHLSRSSSCEEGSRMAVVLTVTKTAVLLLPLFSSLLLLLASSSWSSEVTTTTTIQTSFSVFVAAFTPAAGKTTSSTSKTMTRIQLSSHQHDHHLVNQHRNPLQRVLTARYPFVVENQKHHQAAAALPFLQTTASSSSSFSPSTSTVLAMSSFASDASEYRSSDSDYDDDDDDYGDDSSSGRSRYDDESSMADVPVQELQPVSMSKNGGNRFVALYFDHEVVSDDDDRDALALHYDRNGQTNEDHVMFCRKRNLYNETVNTDSMVDILRSLPILSSDLHRIVGHAMIMESTDIKYVHELLREDPVLKAITKGDEEAYTNRVPLYRWRHIRDHTLRHDDGRFGYPCMMIGLDDEPEIVGNTRSETEKDTLKYLMMSDRVIMAGPLHLPTQLKDDPSSIAVGDLIMFNAKDRHDAIDFVENMPSAEKGLYKDLRVHFYNNLDVTGKFVSEDPLRDAPAEQMKEAMEVWGYPVDDDQTPWLNW